MHITPIKEVVQTLGFCLTTIVGYMLLLYGAEYGNWYVMQLAKEGTIHAAWPIASMLGVLVMVYAGILISGAIATFLFGHPMDTLEKQLKEADALPALSEKQDHALMIGFFAIATPLILPTGFLAIYAWSLVVESGVWHGYVPEVIVGLGYPIVIFVTIGIGVMIAERLLALYYRRYVSKIH